ncbi:MAG: MFS transporter [Bifidobacteriaceae bacterium]|jgi:MFS family permease|nr:MFS transporter [Bifidobacteriaceae bacterium]
MFTPYKKVFKYPGAFRFAFIGIFCRFPQPIYQMAILFVAYHYTSSWTIPAALSSTVALTYAVSVPFIAALIDKWGQSYISIRLTIIYIASMLGVIFSFLYSAPLPWLFIFTALTGASQYYYGSLTRMRWNYIVKNPKHLHTAYAFETAADDFVYILGPVIGVILATGAYPIISLVIVVAIAGIFNIVFYNLKSSEPPILQISKEQKQKDKDFVKPLIKIHGVSYCIAGAGVLGINFGIINVTIPAIYTHAGLSTISGFILAIGSVASLVAGLLYGLIHIKLAQTKRMVILLGIDIVILINYIYLYNNLYFIPIIVFCSSAAIAPIFTVLNTLIRDTVPDARLTQGFSWLSSAVNLGTALGSLIAGITIDNISIQGCMIALVACMFAWVIISFIWGKFLKLSS